MQKPLYIVVILLLVAIAGCTAIRDTGLSVSLQADPPAVFSNGSTALHIDLDNRQEKSARNVVVELFDTGLLSANKCYRFFDRLLPYEFQSIMCRLDAPAIEETSLETAVNSRVAFESELSANQVFEVMKENEYQRRAPAGYQPAPQSYAYSDKNIMLDVEFSEPLPLVVRPGKKYFVYFTIRNIGSGFVGDINPGDFVVADPDPRVQPVLDCPALSSVFSPQGKEFPRIACKLALPPDYFVVYGRPVDFRSSGFIAYLGYTYELRNSLRISIVR